MKLTELGERVLKIVSSKPGFEVHKERLLDEIHEMEKINILNDLYSIYQKIKDGEIKPGPRNDLDSLLAVFLGITTQKPKGVFHNEKRRTYGRAGFPDIDMDFDYARRYEIVTYLQEKYGHDKVGNIGTILTLKTKAAVRKAVEVLDPENSIDYSSKKPDKSRNFALQNEILNTFSKSQMAFKKADGLLIKNIDDARATFKDFDRYMHQYPKVYEVAKRLEGSISAFGCHAAGIVISSIPLEQICPMHMTHGSDTDDYSAKTVATQFSMEEVESLGLIKFDVLGLSTKTALALAIKTIKENHGVDIDLARLPLDDKPTLALLTSGLTDGCFQAEKTGMQQTFQQIGIDRFDDLIVAVAMYRPGPKDYIPELSERKSGKRRVEYPHPLLKKITERTYGIMAYQEQVMQAFMALADLTASDGYRFMKGCAKKKSNLIAEYKELFLKSAVARGVPKKVVESIWADMEKFGGYAFNKSHATSYAYECWKTAYLKAHYMLEFMSARMSVEAQRRDFDFVLKCEQDLKKHGYKILPPDINRSKMVYVKVDDKELLRPLIIKGVGDKAAQDIIENQPYKGKDLLYVFAKKVGPAVNTKVFEALCDANLFGTDKSKAQLLRDFETIKKDRKRGQGRQKGDIFG